MSAIKGSPSQKRIAHSFIDGSTKVTTSSEYFASISPVDSNKGGIDTLPKSMYRVNLVDDTAETVDPADFRGTANPKLRIVKLTGHSYRKGDVLRFTSGANIGMEVSVEVVNTDHIFLGGELLADPDGDTFAHLRYVTLTVGADGQITVSQGPSQYILDGANEEVEEDTVTPANNRPFPSKLFIEKDGVNQRVNKDTVTPANTIAVPTEIVGSNGVEMAVNPSNEAQVRDDDAITELTTANTNLASIDAELVDVNTTLDDIETAIGNLNQQLDVVDSVDGDIIDISSSNIPASSAGYLEIVASLAAEVKEIQVIEDIGEFIGLYSGAAASETFVCVLPQGFTGSKLPINIPAGTRLSVRNMKNATINTDTRLAINFLG